MKFQLILFIIFGIITLMRALNRNAQQQQPGQRANAGQPERRRRIQSDIESFLSEVRQATGAQADDEQQPPPKKKQTSRPARRPQQRRRSRQGSRQSAKPAPQPRPSRSRQALGSGISEHVDTYISKHVADHVDSKVDNLGKGDIAHSVEDHLGARSVEMPAVEVIVQNDSPAAEIRRLLRTRQGVRQAILLNEVLNRPRALRR